MVAAEEAKENEKVRNEKQILLSEIKILVLNVRSLKKKKKKQVRHWIKNSFYN